MKNILILLTLITFSAFSQNPDYHRYGVRTPFTKYISYTTAQRDALTPTSTDRTIIHHKDTGINRLEQWDGDSWEELGGDGAVSSVNFKTGAVVIDPDDLDDSTTTNKFVTEEEKGLISTALQTETDPIFTAWDKDYNDLINNPTIPTSLAAANITVSPAIGGNTDAYAVMQANRTSIDSIQANFPALINTSFRPVTSTSGVFTEAFNDAQPNFELSLDEDVAITITSAVNGNFIIAEIYNDDVSENDFLVTLNGTNEDLIANIPFGERAYFTMLTNSDDDIVWIRSYPKGYKPTTIAASATIFMEGDTVYNDTTVDAGTITLSDCEVGETLKVYINRASMPTLAGTGLVFNPLPNTAPFTSATDMVLSFIVTPLLSGGDMVIDYYLTARQ